jgi:hypothetical protein
MWCDGYRTNDVCGCYSLGIKLGWLKNPGTKWRFIDGKDIELNG